MTRHTIVCSLYGMLVSGVAAVLPCLAADQPPSLVEHAMVRLEGKSSIKRWACETPSASLEMLPLFRREAIVNFFTEQADVDRATLEQLLRQWKASGGNLQQVHVEVEVMAFDCASRGLEKDLTRSLKASEHPAIVYRFNRVAGVSLPDRPMESALVIHTEGQLTLAGVTRTVIIDVKAELRDQHLRLTGHYAADMTEFDVDPPTALFGLIKAHKRVLIDFEFSLPLSRFG